MAGFDWGSLLNMAKSALPGLGGMVSQALPGLGGMLGGLIGGDKGNALGQSLGGLGQGILGGALKPGQNTPWWQGAMQGAAQNMAPALQGLGSYMGGNAGNIANQLGHMSQNMYNQYQQAPSFNHFAQQLPGQMAQYLPGLGQNVGEMFGAGDMGRNIGRMGSTMANMGQGMMNQYQQNPGQGLGRFAGQMAQHLPQLGQNMGSMFGQGPMGYQAGQTASNMAQRYLPQMSHSMNNNMHNFEPSDESSMMLGRRGMQ
jgi:hypothetical protein